ncbi:MAG: 30S ribosomal protein S11, partial [bacterium]|nr:30S ribosomal protein S11 [bacterium]
MGKKRIITGGDGDKEGGQKIAAVSAAKSKRQVLKGTIYITSSYNNTIVSVTDQKGAVFAWATAGSMGFKGARKSTP